MKGQNIFALFSSMYQLFKEKIKANLPFAVRRNGSVRSWTWACGVRWLKNARGLWGRDCQLLFLRMGLAQPEALRLRIAGMPRERLNGPLLTRQMDKLPANLTDDAGVLESFHFRCPQ